jgi:hypothetical protein
LDESDGEILSINSTLLTHSFISNIISFLEIENGQTINIKKYLCDLKEYSKIIPYDFLFKSFLFIDYFWNGIIPNELIDILFGFTSNRNLYMTNINQEIYDILEEKYNEEFIRYNFKFYLMLKYTKGLRIYYLSELMIRKLNISKDDIINQDIGVLFINDLIIPHNNAINQYYMINQNYIFRDKNKHIFDNKKYMIDSFVNSTFQIGLNKNILIICIIQLNEKNNEIAFLSNKNLEIISINEPFDKKFNLSLALIEELKMEIKDIFDIHEHNILNKYRKEFEKIRQIKQYIQLDPKEYVLKNITSLKAKLAEKFKEDQTMSDNPFYKGSSSVTDTEIILNNAKPGESYNPYNDIDKLISAGNTGDENFSSKFEEQYNKISGNVIPSLLNRLAHIESKLSVLSSTYKDIFYAMPNISLQEAKSIDSSYLSDMRLRERNKSNAGINYLTISYDALFNKAISHCVFQDNKSAIKVAKVIDSHDDVQATINDMDIMNKLFADIEKQLDLRSRGYMRNENLELIQKSLYNYYEKRKYLNDIYSLYMNNNESRLLGRKVQEYSNSLNDAIKNVSRVLLYNQNYLDHITTLETQKYNLQKIFRSISSNS